MNRKTHFGFEQVDEKDKEKKVGGVFSSVADNYDLMNDAMSFGLHRLWKEILIELSEVKSDSKVLDIASGTGDIPKILLNKHNAIEVHMTDINASMLSNGYRRAVNENFHSNTYFSVASGESLPYKDNSFDLITVGFGLRNFTNKEDGLKEMRRCLKSNGVLLVLEFSKPQNSLFSKVYDWYSFNIIPKMGKFLANDSESYKYLAESIRMHPDQVTLKQMILDGGFEECKFFNLLNGIVAIHKAYK